VCGQGAEQHGGASANRGMGRARATSAKYCIPSNTELATGRMLSWSLIPSTRSTAWLVTKAHGDPALSQASPMVSGTEMLRAAKKPTPLIKK
jgi:hypothetical protein